MLTTAEMAIMRSTQQGRFDRTATIVRAGTGTDDGAGGRLDSPPLTATVPCSVRPRNSAQPEKVAGAMIQPATQFDITFPALTDVRPEDEVTIEGRTYAVVSVYGPASRETARMVLAVERK